MTQIQYKYNTYRWVGLLLILMLCSGFSFSQNLTGPATVNPSSTHTYTFDNGGLHLYQWIATGGTVLSTTSPSRTSGSTAYTATIQWNASGPASVTFNSYGSNIATLNVTISGGSSGGGSNNFSDENYVHSIAPRIATTNVSGLSNDEKIESISYFDGLGRGKQAIGIRAGGNSQDIVTHSEYDQYGRMKKEFLPFAQPNNGGTFLSNAGSTTNSFYNSKYPGDLNTSNPNPFSEKDFEASPLNRVLKQAAPGNDWRLGGGHEIEMEYLTNDSNDVRRYYVTLSFANNTYTPTLQLSSGYYTAGELYKTITKDENHTSGVNHTTEEYKDSEGRVVLKRTYNAGVAHDTYYVYDDFGNLSYVLPPKSEPHGGKPDATELSELCYQYKYDHRNRLVEKKIPGKGWEYIVYNKLDQPIMTQDANQRNKSPKEWLFIKYDAFERVAYTGLVNNNSTRTTIQGIVNGISTLYVTKSSTSITIDGTIIYYNNGAYPTQYISDILTINYYDNYTFDRDGGNSESAYGVTPITNVSGLATGSKARVLGTNDWITSVTYYDDKSRPIYVYSKNNYLNTTDKVKSDLAFDGTVTETTTTHARSGFSTITTVDSFEYDHMNRLITQKQSINGSAQEVIVDNTYDDIGQLESKGVGGKTTQSRLQDVDYTYNIRGWLKQINNPASLGSDLFGFKINYNTVNHSGTKLYNGNISEVDWRTANTDNSLKWYRYSYDDLNRITSAVNQNNYQNLSYVTYDKNGNILSLKRHGWQNSSTYWDMDVLTYTYQSKSNKLIKVIDYGNDNYGFTDGANTSTEYTYDANGNMLTDANKGITSIIYNHLNLPTSMNISNNSTSTFGGISYIYDATGVKQRKIVNNFSPFSSTTTDYAGNYVYEDNALKFFNHPEGYVEPDGPGWQYVYQYKDHLGNIRLSYADDNNNGSVNSSEIREENNYYPFGLKHKGYNSNINGIDYKYGFVYKEEQEELGLNWHDFGARNYDPAIGRFFGADPLAEMDYNWTPFRYGYNNPISYIDPDGLWELRIAGNDDDGYTVSLHAQKGDNLATLADQFGLSEEEISQFYDKETLNNLRNGKTEKLSTFGGHLKILSNLLSLDGKKNNLKGNCFGTCNEFSKKLDVKVGNNQGSAIKADEILANEDRYTRVKKGRYGDVVRMSEKDGYANQSVKVDIDGITPLPKKGWLIGGALHHANFLLENDKGIQILTKNGPGVRYKILYVKDLKEIYGEIIGIGTEYNNDGIYRRNTRSKKKKKKNK